MDCNVTPIWAKNRNIDSRIPRSNQILRLSATLANQSASFIQGSLTSVHKKNKMDDELPSARFATVDEAEFRRILNEKDAKNTRRATNGAVKIFRTYLKDKNMLETFENFTNEELDDIVGKFYVAVRQDNGDKYQRSSLFYIRYGLNRHLRSLEMLTS